MMECHHKDEAKGCARHLGGVERTRRDRKWGGGGSITTGAHQLIGESKYDMANRSTLLIG